MGSPFTELGLEPDATAADVKHAFWRLAREGAHPDAGGDADAFGRLMAARDDATHYATHPDDNPYLRCGADEPYTYRATDELNPDLFYQTDRPADAVPETAEKVFWSSAIPTDMLPRRARRYRRRGLRRVRRAATAPLRAAAGLWRLLTPVGAALTLAALAAAVWMTSKVAWGAAPDASGHLRDPLPVEAFFGIGDTAGHKVAIAAALVAVVAVVCVAARPRTLRATCYTAAGVALLLSLSYAQWWVAAGSAAAAYGVAWLTGGLADRGA